MYLYILSNEYVTFFHLKIKLYIPLNLISYCLLVDTPFNLKDRNDLISINFLVCLIKGNKVKKKI